MCESLDIIAFLVAKHGLVLPCATFNGNLDKKVKKPLQQPLRMLVRPRITQLKSIGDWDDPRDVAYAKNKYIKQGFDYAKALSETDEHVAAVNSALGELETFICETKDEGNGDVSYSLNQWGFGMDDVTLLHGIT